MIILDKNSKYDAEDIAFLNRIMSGSLNKNIFYMLNGTENKLQIVDNWKEEMEGLPKGYIIEIYNKDDKLMLQTVQG